MWIFTPQSFLSIVAHRSEPGMLLVRARRSEDLAVVFPQAVIAHTPEADYAYRTVLPAATVAAAVSRCVQQIGYPNFKASVKEPERLRACEQVWQIMRDWGRRRTPGPADAATSVAGGLDEMKRGAKRFGRTLADEFRKGFKGSKD